MSRSHDLNHIFSRATRPLTHVELLVVVELVSGLQVKVPDFNELQCTELQDLLMLTVCRLV